MNQITKKNQSLRVMKYETAKIHKAHQTVRSLASSIKSCMVLIAFISLWIHKKEIKFSDPNWRTENSRRLWKIPNLGNIKKNQKNIRDGLWRYQKLNCRKKQPENVCLLFNVVSQMSLSTCRIWERQRERRWNRRRSLFTRLEIWISSALLFYFFDILFATST